MNKKVLRTNYPTVADIQSIGMGDKIVPVLPEFRNFISSGINVQIMKNINKLFDKNRRLIIGFTLLLLLIISIFILINNNRHIHITWQNDQEGIISPLGSVSFKFSRKVDPQMAAELWQVKPDTSGRWVWQDERHAIWYATTPLPEGQSLLMTFHAGVLGKNGERLNEDQNWQAKVREPQIAVIEKTANGGQDLFAIDLQSAETARPLGNTGGKLTGFTPSPDGNQIILEVQDDRGGIDLWIVNRNGSDQHLILDCGGDRCSAASWSPAMDEIAYTRESNGDNTSGKNGIPHVWLLDLQTDVSSPLFQDNQQSAIDALWSPDGKWLSVWNKNAGGVQIINRQSGEIIILKTTSGDPGCWAADSSTLYYTNLVFNGSSFRNVIQKADIRQAIVQTVLGGKLEEEGLSYDYPACNPAGNQIAASVQPNERIPGKQLAIFDLDSDQTLAVTSDMTRFASHYAWNPGGEYLLFQLNQVSHDENDVEIWVWEKAAGKAYMIVSGARSPAWLP